MLPFSGFSFFYFVLAALLLVVLHRYLFKNKVPYKFIILLITLGFIPFYPKPIQLILFVLYSYLAYYTSVVVFRSGKKLWWVIMAILPMLLMKLEIKTEWFQLAGLSYITFRTIQIIVDTEKKEQMVSFFDFLSFTLFTPTLLIGPIDRSQRFVQNIKNNLSFSGEKLLSGIQFFIEGLLFKFVIATLLYDYWVTEINSATLVSHIHYAYAYTAYLYFDFAGYSALAIGFGKCLGIDVPINFNKPFLALNPPDFWRRWHKSLGDWLRDYFFRPIYKELSSHKIGSPLFRQNIALFSTFFLMGCWNGFRWHYIISGSIFGIYSVVHNSYVYYSKKNKRDVIFGKMPAFWVKAISIFIMINLSCFAIYVFSGKFISS